MRIHIFDGPPGLGVTEIVRNIGSREKSKKALCIPEFSKKVILSTLSSESLSEIIQNSIRDLIERIDIAKADNFKMLFLDGSPITYLAYAKLKGLKISSIDMEYVNLLSILIDRRTHVSLRVPNTGFQFRKNMKIMTPDEAHSFSGYLINEYQKRFFTTIKSIGSK